VYLHFRNVSGSLLIWLVCTEVPVDDIGSNFPDVALIRLIFGSLLALCLEFHLAHQLLNRLMVDDGAIFIQLDGNASVTIPAMVLVIDTVDLLAEGVIPIRLPQPFHVIIECRFGHPLELKEQLKGVFRP